MLSRQAHRPIKISQVLHLKEYLLIRQTKLNITPTVIKHIRDTFSEVVDFAFLRAIIVYVEMGPQVSAKLKKDMAHDMILNFLVLVICITNPSNSRNLGNKLLIRPL